MPRKIVDFSARSRIIRDEPFHLHFWESTPSEVLAFLQDPRGELAKIGIDLPVDCRIETTLENHDWLANNSKGLTGENGTIVCGTGGGNVAKNYYKVSLYGHHTNQIKKFEKKLLHSEVEEERRSK